MTPFQQLYLGLGASKKTYLDDVYSTYVYKGAGSGQAINNGIDLSTEGGLVWTKRRDSNNNHLMFDTESGTTKYLIPSSNGVQGSSLNVAFNSNGYTINSSWNSLVNSSGTYASFTFRKAKGFFDIVTWTGNGSNRTISHSLGSIPGMIIIKNRDTNENWRVYHRDLGATHRLLLNGDQASSYETGAFNNTAPTASVFTVGTDDCVNKNGDDFIAYVFAGGASTAATARSVDFSGSSQALSVGSSDDFHFTGDWTAEGYFYVDAHSNYQALFGHAGYSPGSAGGTSLYFGSDGVLLFYAHGGTKITGPVIKTNQWTHVAVARSGSTVTLYIDGENVGSYTESNDFGASDNKFWSVGCAHNGTNNVDFFNGKISNIRVVKGTAVYTSSFKPPTKPLTNITNTKLLCCNNSSTTGSTVTPATITAVGSPTAKTDSPFDDPAGLVFGDSKEEIIKCGSYEGNGSSTGPEINLGWEPQWIIIKNVDSASKNWQMIDSMRGILTDQDDNILMVNHPDAESAAGRVDLTSTGFKLNNSNVHFNSTEETYIYVAIRRPDGYVGKPADAGTDVFALDTGNGSSTIPTFDTGFPVDFGFFRQPSQANDFTTGARLTGIKYMITNDTNNEADNSYHLWDSNVGWSKGHSSSYNSWNWKRHAGFDVVCYEGTQTVQHIKHSMNKAPEMMWIKNRDSSTYNWSVYHSGLGDNRFKLWLDLNNDYSNDQAAWNNTAPTSTHFTLGTDASANHNGSSYIAMLFASVNGISKCGSYTGNGVKTGNVQTLGFQPRFILIKCTDTSSTNWMVFDTLLGINSGDDNFLPLNSSSSTSAGDFIDLTSDGFDVVEDNNAVNGNNKKYIYYAHA